METIKEIQDKILAVEERLQSLTDSNGLKAADIISLTREIDALKAEVVQLNTPTPVPPPPPPYRRTIPITTTPKRPPSKLTEGNIGRYGVGVLASLLILLAVGTVAGTIWAYIPDVVKFLCIFAVGGVCEFFGWMKLRKSGTMNGFWTSVAGLGAAICFTVFVFGQVIWMLYPSGLTAIFLLSWFAVNFALATNMNSKVFYTITYIGGYISTSLILAEGGMSLSKEVLLAAAPLVIYLIGKFGFRISHNSVLPVFNTLFCLAEFLLIRGDMFIPYFYTETLVAPYQYRVLPYFLIVLAILILLDMSTVWRENWRYVNVMNVILPGIGSFVAAHACIAAAHIILSRAQADIGSWILTLLIIAGCSIAHREKWGKYLLGTSPVVASAFVMISESLLKCGSLLPALFSAILLFTPVIRRDKYGRAAGMVIYLLAFMNAPFGALYEGELFAFFLWIQTILLVTLPIANFIFSRRQKDGLLPEIEALVGFACAAFAIQPLAKFLGASDALWVLVLAIFALVYRYFLPNKPVSENPWEREIARVGLVGIHIFVCVCAFLDGLIMPDTADKVISTAILTAYSIASIHKAVNERRMAYSLLSVVFCNLNTFFLLNMWHSNSTSILISCAGLVLAAAFIGIGFWQKEKNIRVTGLVAMIGYVFKIALVDVREFAGSGSQVFALLAGGLICFAVSFAYNRLNRLLGEDEISEGKSLKDEMVAKERRGRRWYL